MNAVKHIELLKTIAIDVEPVSNAKLAAMILYKGKVVSIGFNQNKSHPFAAKYSKHPEAIYLHAEADAIRKAKRLLSVAELKRATLIICRVKQTVDGEYKYGMAKPCSGCADCIESHGLKTVIYTNDQAVNSNKIIFTTETKN